MKTVVLALAAAMVVVPISDDFKRERGGKNDAVKDGWEGKAPPAIEAEKWMNTPGDKPMTWASLKGKVVLVDTWAYW